MDFRFHEDALLDERVYYDHAKHRLPDRLSALFIDHQKNKGLLGRMVTAFGYLNDKIAYAVAPAPDVEAAFRVAPGKHFHSAMDMVWGLPQVGPHGGGPPPPGVYHQK